MTEHMLCTFERKILRRIYDPIQDKGRRRPKWYSDICILYKDLNIVDDNKIRRQGWAGEWKMKGYEKEVRKGKFHERRPVEKQKIRWKDVIRRDTSKILGISGWSRTAEDREVWRRLLRKVMAQNGL